LITPNSTSTIGALLPITTPTRRPPAAAAISPFVTRLAPIERAQSSCPSVISAASGRQRPWAEDLRQDRRWAQTSQKGIPRLPSLCAGCRSTELSVAATEVVRR
jgi:hypothetical protein